MDGAIKRQRQLKISPKEPGEEELASIFRESMENWKQPGATSPGVVPYNLRASAADLVRAAKDIY